MRLNFSKYHGSGNDFILIDDKALSFPTDDSELIKKLCHRQLGIGADGLILLQPSSQADFRFRIFNADGKEASMCGNGMRCLVHFAHTLGYQKDEYLVETQKEILSCQLSGNFVTSSFPCFNLCKTPIKINSYTVYFVNTGVPHAAVFVESLKMADFCDQAREIRYHPFFQPEGINVSFVKIDKDHTLFSRTYERGVEAETLSCGTAAVAIAFIAHHFFQIASPVRVSPASQDCLIVDLTLDKIYMKGPVCCVFHGSLILKEEVLSC